jgi:hypothetical protein
LLAVNATLGIKLVAEFVTRNRIMSSLLERDFGSGRLREIIRESGFRFLNISPTLFNPFDSFQFNYIRELLCFLGIYRYYCKFHRAFVRRFPVMVFGYSFMIALAQRPGR